MDGDAAVGETWPHPHDLPAPGTNATSLRSSSKLEAHTTTVRAVATNFGPVHMGRFAAAYGDAFGESPSETLNRHPHWPDTSTAIRRSHASRP